jgi:hypothetical protein
MPLRVGEIVSATVKRKITSERVLILLKGHVLVAEPEQDVMPGDEIKVQVLTVFPRVRLRLLPSSIPPTTGPRPLDLRT